MRLFSLLTNDTIIASYADDNTPYMTLWKRNLAIEKLEQCSDSLFAWFQNNGMKADAVINVIVSEYQQCLLTTISLKQRSMILMLKVATNKNC